MRPAQHHHSPKGETQEGAKGEKGERETGEEEKKGNERKDL
jgi:hypothetical protein